MVRLDMFEFDNDDMFYVPEIINVTKVKRDTFSGCHGDLEEVDNGPETLKVAAQRIIAYAVARKHGASPKEAARRLL